MKKVVFFLILVLSASLIWAGGVVSAQDQKKYRSQEISDSDGLPVLLKHLPEWEAAQSRASFANNVDDLKNAVGERPVLNVIDFPKGTEAVTADYPVGRLLIIEFMTPQASIDADVKITQWLAENPNSRIEYRRIGNYNAFVFDATDLSDAKVLLSEVKYEKDVQWLGEDPFLFKKLERHFAVTTADIFLSTFKAIALGIGFCLIAGIAAGFLYFRFREKRRGQMREFTDAGGMVRLNLDGFTPELAANRLLNE